MQHITIAGQIGLPKDEEAKAEAIERIGNALRELTGLMIHQSGGEYFRSYTPFQSFQLSKDGILKMTVVGDEVPQN